MESKEKKEETGGKGGGVLASLFQFDASWSHLERGALSSGRPPCDLSVGKSLGHFSFFLNYL